jgi:hypothetical protein
MRGLSLAGRNLAVLILEVGSRSRVGHSPLVPILAVPILAVLIPAVPALAVQAMAGRRNGDIVLQSVRHIASAPMTALICTVTT